MLPVFMCLGARDNHGDRVGQSRTVVYCNVDPEYIAVAESTATPDNQGPVQDRANSTYQSSRHVGPLEHDQVCDTCTLVHDAELLISDQTW